jgi:uroporphyrinogen decarboxylase
MFSSKERVQLSLEHQEPEQIPFDLGSTSATGICAEAYRNLLEFLNIQGDIVITDMMQQLAKVDDPILEFFKVDTRGLSPNLPGASDQGLDTDERFSFFYDRWGIKYAMPKSGGHYYDMVDHPLKGPITRSEIDRFHFPDPQRIQGSLRQQVQKWTGDTNPKAVILEATEGGILELCSWLRGYEDFFVDLAYDLDLACSLMDKILDFKIRCWEAALREIGNEVLVLWESDDLGFQDRPMISPKFYRNHVKPRHRELFDHIKQLVPHKVYLAFHSCGSIYDFIPDLIEIGVDAINPVQVSAAKMDSKLLKKEFGREMAFWGGGIDTQHVLPKGTPQEVKDEVRKRIDDLAPEGGFIFSTVHNIQADVPPENILAMWEAFQEYSK